MENLSGVYLPVVTPFYDNAVDYESYVNLLNYYTNKDISGFIPLGTTGESPCITDDEYKRIIHTTLETVDGQLPVFAGIGGNFTDKVLKRIREFEIRESREFCQSVHITTGRTRTAYSSILKEFQSPPTLISSFTIFPTGLV